ncbi:MAG: hypothetical protein EOO85_12500 [Pedobacter sp.]|nr:MAG: hypothetical protein EOO85_12500 [Pedobacter sp.]
MSVATRYKEAGDQHYRQKSYVNAIEDYSKAIALLENQNDSNLIYICYSNRCACYLQQKKTTEALQDAQKCVQIKPDWHKGMYG